MQNQKKSYLFALATVALWSTIASASKITLRYLNPVELLFYASAISTCVLFVILVLQHKASSLLSVTKSEWLTSFGFGALNPLCYYLVLFKAYDVLPAQQAQIINYTWAITLSVLSIPLLKQKVSGAQWIAIVTSYCGVLVIATKGDIRGMQFENPQGVGFALLSTIIWALYWILNTRDKRDPVVGLFLNFLCAMPMVALLMFFTNGFKVLAPLGYIGAAYIGVFEMGVAFVFWLLAMKYTESTAKIANLIFLSPFVSLFFIHHVVGEEIYPSTWVGLAFVILGLALQSYANWKAKP